MNVQEIETHLLPVAGSQVYVRSYGDPTHPALILTHGYLQTSQCWRRIVEPLAESHQVIVWDLPGHGFSGPAQGRVLAEDLAESLRAIVLHYHLEEKGFALAAWSFGGMITREYLLRYGETGVTHLILIAALTNLLNLQEIWDEYPGGEADAAMMEALTSGHASSFERDTALRNFVAKLSLRPLPVAEYYETLGYNAHSLMHLEQTPIDLTSFTETRSASVLKNLSMPVLVLSGNNDALVPHAALKAQLESLPYTALLRMYAGCGHSPHVEMPKYVLSDIRAFLQAAL